MPIVEFGGIPYAVFADREPIKRLATDVAKSLRAGDTRAVAAQLDSVPELAVLGVPDAILGATPGTSVEWSPLRRRDAHNVTAGWFGDDWKRMSKFEDLGEELAFRGATYREVFSQAVMRGDLSSPQPRAVATRTLHDVSRGAIDVLQDRGVFVINPVPHSVTSKAVAAEAWAAAGVNAPRTVTRLVDDKAAAAAYRKLGARVVIKHPFGTRGEQVVAVESRRDAIASVADMRGELLRLRIAGLDPALGRPIMQEHVAFGGVDFRVHYSRDPLTGVLEPIGGVARRTTSGDFRTNLSTGGAVRPIYLFDGGDPELTAAAVQEGRKAGDALGLDWYAADIAIDEKTGRAILFEVDTGATPLERHFPVPLEQQTFRHLADLLLHGDPAAIQAARGATLIS